MAKGRMGKYVPLCSEPLLSSTHRATYRWRSAPSFSLRGCALRGKTKTSSRYNISP